MSATIEHPVSLSQRKSSLARDELLIEYMLAEALRRTGKCLAKLLDLYAERTFSVPGRQEHVPPFDQARCFVRSSQARICPLLAGVCYITY